MDAAWRLDGRVALVTGGTRGIGRGVVEALAERGARVWFAARTAADVARTEAALRAAGADATGIVADVTTDDGRRAVLDALRAGGDRLDLLVHNVGTNIRKPTLEATAEDWATLTAINTTPVWELSRACFPWLQVSGAASVVILGSVSSTRAVRTSTAIYAMTKGALDGLARFLAAEWGPHGIRVNVVAPWYVRTPLTVPVLSDPAKRDAILARTPLGRVGEPEDIGRTVAFLCLPASAWITGVVLPVDGGFSILG